MARFSELPLDTTISDGDLLAGTDSGDGMAGTSGTSVNFPLLALRGYFLGMNFSPGSVPVREADGTLVDSTISQTNDVVTFGGDVIVTGNILDADGNPIVGGGGTGGVGPAGPIGPEGPIGPAGPVDLNYGTAVHTVPGSLALYTTHVFLSGANTYDLPTDAPDGAWVKIVNISGVANVMIRATGRRFMNTDTDTLILDDHSASFELVYVEKPPGATPVGWVIVGAN